MRNIFFRDLNDITRHSSTNSLRKVWVFFVQVVVFTFFLEEGIIFWGIFHHNYMYYLQKIVYYGCVLMFWRNILLTVIWFLWAFVSFRSVIIEHPIITRRHISWNRKSLCLSIQYHRDNVSHSEKVYPTQWNQWSQTNRRYHSRLLIINCSFCKKRIHKWRMKDRKNIEIWSVLFINKFWDFYILLTSTQIYYFAGTISHPSQSCINFPANSVI